MRTRYILTTCLLAFASFGLIACQQSATMSSYADEPTPAPTTAPMETPTMASSPVATAPCEVQTTACGDVSNTVIIPIVVEKGTPIHPNAPVDRYNACQTQNKQLRTGKNIPLMPSERSSADTVNVETPMRCRIPAPTTRIISDIPLKAGDFELTRLEKNDPMPRFEVNGYTFNNQSLDMAIQTLVSEAGIKVYSDDGLFPDMSAEDIHGELSAVVEELADSGDAYVRYDAAKKRLYLSRWARFELKVPGGSVGMYAVLDALRGANITNVQPDWGKNELYFRVTKPQQATIQRLIDYLKEDPRLLLFDVAVYRIFPRNDTAGLNWQNVIQSFGDRKVNMSVNGLLGRMIITDHQDKQASLLNNLKAYARVDLVSKGVAVMPNGWKVRFDIGQCAMMNTPEKDLSLLLQSNIQSAERVESNIALDTVNGEITSFYSFYSIDDDLNIIGIPGTVFNPQARSVEYLITMKPRVMRLVK